MDDNSPQIPPPPPTMPKHSTLGILSFTLSITAILFAIPYILNLSGIMEISNEKAYLPARLMIVAGLISLAGTGLGIAALVKKETGKVLNILGLLFNVVILLSSCPLGIYIVLALSGLYLQ